MICPCGGKAPYRYLKEERAARCASCGREEFDPYEIRLIIAGGRDLDSQELVNEAMEEFGLYPDVVLCGGAKGVDSCGRAWANASGIPVEEYPADWDTHGKAAGPIRNAEMAKNANTLLLIWDGESKGSASMMEEAERNALTIYEVRIV